MSREGCGKAFVTDCDGTIVHYSATEDVDALVALPPSASGMRGFVHRTNILLIEEISSKAEVICCSGMRMDTMLGRYSYFPTIKYWICENGGRIFRRRNEVDDGTDVGLVEDNDWLSYSKVPEHLDELERFAGLLQSQGFVVDREGYSSMFRVKGKDLERVIPQIPSNLKYTFNLGHLDVYLPRCGKRAAIQWLLARVHPLDQRYLFMGDDDNDIEAATQAETAFICIPCSLKMREWVDGMQVSGREVIVPPENLQHHSATTYLLQSVQQHLTRIS